ncbi:MAG: hypothetical protein WDM81_14750 [Rhizomicrobium sp.]
MQDVRTVDVGRDGLKAQVDAARGAIAAGADRSRAHRDPRGGSGPARRGRRAPWASMSPTATQLFSLVPPDRWVIANYRRRRPRIWRRASRCALPSMRWGGASFRGHVQWLSPATGSEFSVLRPDNATGNFVKVPQRIGVRILLDPGQPDAARLRPRHVGGDSRRHQRRSMTRAAAILALLPAGGLRRSPARDSAAGRDRDRRRTGAARPAAATARSRCRLVAGLRRSGADPYRRDRARQQCRHRPSLRRASPKRAASFILPRRSAGPTSPAPPAAGASATSIRASASRRSRPPAQAEVSVSYDLDLFGRLADASDAAARAALLSSEAARDNVRLATAASAASGYITLRALDARLDVLRRTLAARADSLRIARRAGGGGLCLAARPRPGRSGLPHRRAAHPCRAARESRGRRTALSILLGDNPRAIERGVELHAIALPVVPPAGAGLADAPPARYRRGRKTSLSLPIIRWIRRAPPSFPTCSSRRRAAWSARR